MSNEEQTNKSTLHIETRGLGIKTPDEFLVEPGMQIRFLYDNQSVDQTHKLEIRIEIDESEYQTFIPEPNSKVTIEITNALAIEQPDKNLESNLINLNEISGHPLPDRDHKLIDLIDVMIRAKEVEPYSAELNKEPIMVEVIKDGVPQPPGNAKKYTRCIGADFELDNDAEIIIEIDSPKISETIKPDGKNISIILDNDCLSEKGDGFSDFHLYYHVLNGEGTEVKIEPPKIVPGNQFVACNAVGGGKGR